jgi:hypothetical protein
MKICTIADVPDQLGQAWLQHLRDFDAAHPGCVFRIEAAAPDMRTSEVLDAMKIDPPLAETTVIDTSPNYLGRIDRLWAALSVDEGGEGLCAAPMAEGMLSVPLIAADKRRLSDIRPWAYRIAHMTSRVVRIVKFDHREDVEIFRP